MDLEEWVDTDKWQAVQRAKEEWSVALREKSAEASGSHREDVTEKPTTWPWGVVERKWWHRKQEGRLWTM